MGTKISELSAVSTPLGGTETLAAVQTTTKKVTTAQLATYVLDVAAWAAATTTPASGQLLFGFESDGTKKRLDLDAMGDYIGDYLAAGVTAVTPLATDHVMLNDAGVLEKVLVSVLNTKMLDNSTAPSADFVKDIRDVSALTVRSLDGSEHMLVGESTTPKRALLSSVAAYVHAEIDTYLATLDALTAGGTPIADGDRFYVSDGGVGKQMVASEVAAYVETKVAANITADVWDDATGAVTPVDGSVFVLENAGVRKTALGSELAIYATSHLIANAAATTPVLDAYRFLFFDGTDSKTATGAVLAGYIGQKILDDAAVTTPALGTDKIFADRSGEITLTASVLATYIFTQDAKGTTLQDKVLEFDGLAAKATPAGTELFVMDDSGVAKKGTLDQLATFIYADTTGGLNEYVNTLADGAPIVNTDEFFVQRGSGAAGKKIAASDLLTYMETGIWNHTPDTDPVDADEILIERGGSYFRLALSELQEYMTDAIASAALAAATSGWSTVDSGDYTALPAGVNTITMSATAGITVGAPLRYTYGGTTYYGIVASVVTDSLITLRGATLVTGGGSNLTALAYGLPSRTRTLRLELPGAYLTPWVVPTNDANANGLNDSEVTETAALAAIARRYVTWQEADAYLVSVSVTQGTADTGAVDQPYVGVRIANVDVLTDNGNDGIQIAATPGNPALSGEVAIALAAYDIELADGIEIKITAQTGLVGDASDVSVELVFVFA